MQTKTWEIETVETPTKPDKFFGYRHLQSLLMFLCLTIAYAMRVNMSVGIVAMTDHNTRFDFPTYGWSKTTQDLILSSFFWGYVITQVPAAYVGRRWGTHIPLAIAIAVCSLATLVTPLAAECGWGAVCGCRVIQGLSQGFCFPSMHTLLAKWIPASERGRLGTFVYAGAQFGTVISLPISGLLASSEMLGWPSVFYLHGAAGIVWVVLWFFFGGSSPAEYKRMSDQERKYIEASLGKDVNVHDTNMATPWRALFTSLPMWALIIVHAGQNWGFWTLLTQIPTYMKDILKYDIKENGFTSALPYLAMWLLSFVFSFISDFVINRGIVSTAVARKVGNSIGHWIPAAALIALGYVSQQNKSLAVGLLTVAVGFNSATYVGFQVNHIDLAPNHAGTMMGITNGVANVMSIIAPLLVGVIVTEDDSIGQWRTVFFISAAVYFLGNLFFVCFGSANVQPWNDVMVKPKDTESPDDKKDSSKDAKVKEEVTK